MIANDPFERLVADWLHADAEHHVPDHLDAVLRLTGGKRQRPAWSSLERWLPMDTTFRPRPFQSPRLGQVLLVAMLILAVLAGLLIYAGSHQQHLPPPFGLARNGELVTWENLDIVARATDGSGPRTLVGGPSEDFAPLLTRDGTGFAFFRAQSEHESLVMFASIDGSDVRQVLPKPLVDADWWEWSAASDRLAIVNTARGRRALTIVDITAGTSKDLDLGGLNVDNDVYWLPPEGSRLVFTARPDGTGDVPASIYTIRPDGTDMKRTTRLEIGPWYNGLDVAPDGKVVSFWDFEPDASADGMGSHVHYLELATEIDRRTIFDPSADGETDLRFSPDGVHVVLQREASKAAQLMITTRGGTGPSHLVGPSFGLEAEPFYGFSPDGKTVVLVFPNTKPYFFDVESGAETRGVETIGDFAGYQRLAP